MQTYRLARTLTGAHARARAHSRGRTRTARDRQLASKHHGWSFGKSTN